VWWFGLLAGLREAQPCRYCVYLVAFAPQGRHIAPINVKFGMGGADRSQMSFIGAEMWEYSPKTIKILNFLP